MNTSLPSAIILDGGVNAVSIARSLAGMGVRVYAINKPDAPVRHSRFARWIPNGTAGSEPGQWSDFLASQDSDHLHGSVLLAAGDAGLQILGTHREWLAEKFRLDASNTRAQLCMLNKLCTYHAAIDAKVPTPRFWVADSTDQLHKLRKSLVYPLIVKPQLSHLLVRRIGEKFLVARNFDQLVAAFSMIQEAGVEILLVEQIPGGDENSLSYYTYVDHNGEALFDFTRRLVRRYPPGKGIATYQVSSEFDPVVREPSLRLLRHVGLCGLANVEFLRDDRDGQFKLIECNGRFTAANEMLKASGIDLARLVYRRIVGLSPEPMREYRAGVSLWHPLEDTRAFLSLRRQDKLGLQEWLASVLRPHVLPLFCWHDPLPSVMHLVGRFKRLASVLLRSSMRRHPAPGPALNTQETGSPVQAARSMSETCVASASSDLHLRNVAAEDLTDFAAALFVAEGVHTEEADLIARSLVQANLRGYDSHGVMRIPSYIDKIRKREVIPGARFEVTKELPYLLMADGHWGFGQVQGRRLARQLIDKCKQVGLAIGTLRQTTHVGRLGEYCEMAAEAGLVAMVMVNTHGTSKWVAPPGGKAARLGTNPMAFGVPQDGTPVILDFSTSATSEGSVRIRNISGQQCPPGWLLDSQGRPTTDPGVLYSEFPGTILPLGGDQIHKGFGLGLIVEIFAGGLSGGVCSQEIPRNPKGNCVFMELLDPAHFCGTSPFSNTVSDLLAFVRGCPSAAGMAEVTLPGDKARRTRRVRMVEGIPFNEQTWATLAALANQLGVPIPEGCATEPPPVATRVTGTPAGLS